MQAKFGKPSILGIALGSKDDNRIEVLIDGANWMKMSELERTTTMYHELSHDILNAAHVDDEAHLMHPTYQYKDIASLVLGLTEIFQEYKKGTIRTFNHNHNH